MFECKLHFEESLKRFIHRRLKGGSGPICIQRSYADAPVKDLIESCGIPHPLVNGIRVADRWVDFDYVPDHGELINVLSVWDDPLPRVFNNALQNHSLVEWNFILDGHLGKLARYLRLLGFDSWHQNEVEDDRLIDVMVHEKRILITRDRPLLMRKLVRHGYFPLSDKPLCQLEEILERFGLLEAVNPFSRCLVCNGLLRNAPKHEVLKQLEPLTKIHYQDFARCNSCQRVFWEGSHFEKLNRVLADVTGNKTPDF